MADKLCPLMRDALGAPAPCIEHRCTWYIQLLGKHPQKDAPVEEWGCTVAFLPILLIENAQQVRQAGAAIESARNEARKDAASIGAGLVEVAQAALAAAQPAPREHVLELRDAPPAVLEVREAPRRPLLKRLLRMGD